MATTDINELAQRAKAATDAIVASAPPGHGSCGRAYADLAAELSRATRVVPAAVTDAGALIDIAAEEPFTEEMHDAAAFVASALFLGRRLFDSNVEQLVEGHPELAELLEPAREIACRLGESSRRLASAVRASDDHQARAA